MMSDTETRDRAVQVVDPGLQLPLVNGAGEARAVVWPGMGASLRSMQRISLGRFSNTVELTHPGEAVYYVIAGGGQVHEPGGHAYELTEGAMFLVDPGTRYVVEAGPEGAELVGGPCPADPSLYEDIGV